MLFHLRGFLLQCLVLCADGLVKPDMSHDDVGRRHDVVGGLPHAMVIVRAWSARTSAAAPSHRPPSHRRINAALQRGSLNVSIQAIRSLIATRPIATFSIVAADLATGDLGIAVASEVLNLAGGGALASAGRAPSPRNPYSNTAYGPDGIALMREGYRRLMLGPPGGVADPGARSAPGHGRCAGGGRAHTGSGCLGGRGHRVGRAFPPGNILVGGEPVVAMAATFQSASAPCPNAC